jgi:hypothetical protein
MSDFFKKIIRFSAILHVIRDFEILRIYDSIGEVAADRHGGGSRNPSGVTQER